MPISIEAPLRKRIRDDVIHAGDIGNRCLRIDFVHERQDDRSLAMAITEFVNAEPLDTKLQRRSRKTQLLGGSVFPRHLTP